jgi:hypothetical protein
LQALEAKDSRLRPPYPQLAVDVSPDDGQGR